MKNKWRNLKMTLLCVGTLILVFMAKDIFIGSEGKAALGEGTGHQRVQEILGYKVAENKIHLNQKDLPLKTRYLPIKEVHLFILDSEEVVKPSHIERFNYEANPAIFGHLKSLFLKNRETIKRDDILAVVTQ